MQIKTVRVTNPRNVLVQVPGFVVAQLGLQLNDRLEVSFNEGTKQVTIGKAVHRRGDAAEKDEGVA